MSHNLDELYLTWLYRQFADPDVASPSHTFWKLANCLFKKEFIWFVPNDDNRVEDGRALRDEFVDDLGLEDVDPDWMDLGCSMLELIVGLSRRLSFHGGGEPSEWFMQLLKNLGIRYSDRGRFPQELVEDVCDLVIWRAYEPDGSGGFFPLRHPDRDQRDVELWYALNAYLLEHD